MFSVFSRWDRSFLLVLSLLFSGCGQPGNLDLKEPESASLSSSSCTQTLNTTTANLRILFVVDNSASTWDTDKNLYYRTKTIENFLQKYGSKSNLTYGFGYFTDIYAKFYDSSPGGFAANPFKPFGDANFLMTALNQFKTVTESGSTPYQAAFNGILTVISSDIANSSTNWKYVVVFMSDGQPSDILNPVQTNLTTAVNRLKQNISSRGRMMTMSTVYFGPATELTAIENLRVMSQAGEGQFVNTNLSSDLTISDLITVPGETCH